MSLPIPPNTTCDIYRNGRLPPAAPDVAAVPCYLTCDWRGGQEAGDRVDNQLTWTHVMLVDSSVDVRDAYAGASTFSKLDTIYVPDKTGTPFTVIFIELAQRGTPHEHKRVFLDRGVPTWPTNEL
jgi:hypothetical protein